MISFIDLKKNNFVYFCLIISFVLRLEFVLLRPVWQAPDEFPHFYHVKYIAKYNNQPQFKPEFPNYEAGQPVLYYFLSSILLKFTPAFSEEKYENINEMFEIKKIIPEVIVLRLFSLFLGLITILIIWKIFLKIYKEKPEIPNTLIILLLFHPAFLENTTSITNDTLAYLIGALIIMQNTGNSFLEKPFETGIFLSLGLLTKSSMLLFIPYIIILIIVSKYTIIEKIKTILLTLTPVVMTYFVFIVLSNTFNITLWFFPPLQIYSEPLSLFRIFQVLKNFFGSFWAAFGRIYEIQPHVLIYVIIFLPVTIISIIGIFKFVQRKYKSGEHLNIEAGFLLITFFFIISSLFFSLKCTWTGTENTSWGKNIFPVIPAIYLLLYTGLINIFKKRTLDILLLLAGVCFLIDIWGLIKLI